MQKTLEEIREYNEWTLEEASAIYDINEELLESYEKFYIIPDMKAIWAILKATGLEYDDINFFFQDQI